MEGVKHPSKTQKSIFLHDILYDFNSTFYNSFRKKLRGLSERLKQYILWFANSAQFPAMDSCNAKDHIFIVT